MENNKELVEDASTELSKEEQLDLEKNKQLSMQVHATLKRKLKKQSKSRLIDTIYNMYVASERKNKMIMNLSQENQKLVKQLNEKIMKENAKSTKRKLSVKKEDNNE